MCTCGLSLPAFHFLSVQRSQTLHHFYHSLTRSRIRSPQSSIIIKIDDLENYSRFHLRTKSHINAFSINGSLVASTTTTTPPHTPQNEILNTTPHPPPPSNNPRFPPPPPSPSPRLLLRRRRRRRLHRQHHPFTGRNSHRPENPNPNNPPNTTVHRRRNTKRDTNHTSRYRHQCSDDGRGADTRTDTSEHDDGHRYG